MLTLRDYFEIKMISCPFLSTAQTGWNHSVLLRAVGEFTPLSGELQIHSNIRKNFYDAVMCTASRWQTLPVIQPIASKSQVPSPSSFLSILPPPGFAQTGSADRPASGVSAPPPSLHPVRAQQRGGLERRRRAERQCVGGRGSRVKCSQEEVEGGN